jgi:hypothetical protein
MPIAIQRDVSSKSDSFIMEIVTASLLDLNALNKLEHICFEKDAWPFLDLLAVLTFSDVVRLKAVEDGQMIGFVAGDPHPSEGFSWIATIGVLPGNRPELIARLRGKVENTAYPAFGAWLE